MALLSPADQDRLQAEFRSLARPVRLVFFTQTFECPTCPEARQILGELESLSDRITIEERNVVLDKDEAAAYGIDRAPGLAIVAVDEAGAAVDSRIRFLGAPAGYEFASLVRAVLLVGGSASTLSAEGRNRLESLDRPVILKVFTTPTCPHCPRAVTLAHEVAFASPYVTAFAVEATEFPDLARQYAVTGVPKTVIDETSEILGAVPEEALIGAIVGDARGALSS